MVGSAQRGDATAEGIASDTQTFGDKPSAVWPTVTPVVGDLDFQLDAFGGELGELTASVDVKVPDAADVCNQNAVGCVALVITTAGRGFCLSNGVENDPAG